jgi:general secretion pathway protein I
MTMRRRAQSGFTLLEVVVAFVVLSLVLSVVFEVFTTWLARTADLSDYSQGLAIAQSRLAAVGVEEAIKEGETRGESPDRRYQWALRIERYGEPRDPGAPIQSTYSLYRAQVAVKWRGGDNRDRDIVLSGLQLGPRL